MAEDKKEEVKDDTSKKDAIEDIKKAEAKDDADAGTKLDKMLSCVDAITKGVDSLTKRMDALESRDDKKRDDAEEKEKAEADAKKKADAEEEEKKAADAKKRDDDAKKKDAEGDKPEFLKKEEVAADKKRKDDDDAKKKADAKADSDIAKRIADVEAKLPKAMSDADYSAMQDAQAKADSVFQAFGQHAPRFMQGESLLAYRLRLAENLKQHSKTWKGFDLSKIADSEATFAEVERGVYADAMSAALHPTDLPGGTLRMISRSSGGHEIHEFVGEPRAWMDDIAGPTRQFVTNIKTGSNN